VCRRRCAPQKSFWEAQRVGGGHAAESCTVHASGCHPAAVILSEAKDLPWPP
jgi:hypothetical protein